MRRLLSRYANVYVRHWLRLGVRDATAGLRAYRAEVLAAIELDTVRSEGYGFQIEMTRRVAHLDGRIAEVPIIFSERAVGRSKMTWKIVLEALGNVLIWGLRDRRTRACR